MSWVKILICDNCGKPLNTSNPYGKSEKYYQSGPYLHICDECRKEKYPWLEEFNKIFNGEGE